MFITQLPIRAVPYQHQIEAYLFVCRLFGIDPEESIPEMKEVMTMNISSRGAALLMEMG